MNIDIGKLLPYAFRAIQNLDKIGNFVGNATPVVPQVVSLYGKAMHLAPEALAVYGQVSPLISDGVVLVNLIAPGLIAPPTDPAPAPFALDVRWLQAALNKANNAGLKVDGSYGRETHAAVTSYQVLRPPLKVDSWAGPATVLKLLTEVGQNP